MPPLPPSPDNPFRPFFEPQGIAVVGARRSLGFGYGIPLYLQRQGWGDRLFLVNPVGGALVSPRAPSQSNGRTARQKDTPFRKRGKPGNA